MPRLPHSLVLQARKISSFLPPILQTTRNLQSAINELRWLTEHVVQTTTAKECPERSRSRLLKLVRRRARGEPLQYILGSQPFGELDIKCEKGVLIPRPETEAYVQHLLDLLKTGDLHYWIKSKYMDMPASSNQRQSALRILDACSGTGCISLLTYSRLKERFRWYSVIGMDISQKAVDLANENIQRNAEYLTTSQQKPRVSFIRRDIFESFPPSMYDIIISNPPYISPTELKTDTERSVRNWEPREALVPKVPTHYVPKLLHPQDIFYGRLVELYHECFTKVLLMEVGDASQAVRVLQEAIKLKHIVENSRFEIWRDNPSVPPEEGATDKIIIDKCEIPVLGAGKVRAVLLFRTQNFTPEGKKEYFNRHLDLSGRSERRQQKQEQEKIIPEEVNLDESQEKSEEYFRESEIPEGPAELAIRDSNRNRERPADYKHIHFRAPDRKPSRTVLRSREKMSRDSLREGTDPDLEHKLKPMLTGWKESKQRVHFAGWTNRKLNPRWKFPDYVGDPKVKKEFGDMVPAVQRGLGLINRKAYGRENS